MFSLFWVVLYIMNRLIQVKNDVQLSTPRGFYTTIRNSSDNSFLFSTPPSSTASTSTSSLSMSSSSISNFKSTQPTITITLADGNVLEAFKTMNFHRSKMNEYLCDDFITTARIAPIFEKISDSDSTINSRNVAAKLKHDVGSNSYKTWLMRTISNGDKSQQGNSTQRQDPPQYGYAEGRFKKPFYKLGSVLGSSNRLDNSNNYDNNIEEDIHFGMSFPAYHGNRNKESFHPIYQPIHKRTSAIPITLSAIQKRKHPTQLIPNENIIGVNLHGRYMNLTEHNRKNLKNNISPLDTFQRSDLPQNHLGQASNKDTIAIYVTQSNPPSLGEQMVTEGNTFWTSNNNVEVSNYNGWSMYPDNGDNMQRNPQIPPPDTDSMADSFGAYSYTTIPAPSIDNNVAPYTQHYPSITDSSKEYTYPPYYPPIDAGNGYNGQFYGYPDATSSTPSLPSFPQQQGLPSEYGYQPPVTSTLYGYPPSITSWPYGWQPTTPKTTVMPMIVGWMPMTTPVPAIGNTPPPSSTMPSTMAMIPMMPAQPTPPPAPPPPPPTIPTYSSPPPNPVPMVPIYGYLPTPPASIPSSPLSNSYGYQPPAPPAMGWPSPPSTPLPYGTDYTFSPPDNQHPYFDSVSHSHFDLENHPTWFNKPNFANDNSNSDGPSDFTDYDSFQDSQDSQDLQDSRDNAISNILGPDAYELILTAIAFMAFGSYFMNMMLQLMQGNSSPTMMIVGNGGNTAAAPVLSDDQMRKFSNHTNDDQRLLDEVLVSIEKFHDWIIENSTDIR